MSIQTLCKALYPLKRKAFIDFRKVAAKAKAAGDLSDRFAESWPMGMRPITVSGAPNPNSTDGLATAAWTFCSRRDRTDLDHEHLFRSVTRVAGAAMLMNDDGPEVREMARKHDLHVEAIPMKKTHHTVMHELIILKP